MALLTNMPIHQSFHPSYAKETFLQSTFGHLLVSWSIFLWNQGDLDPTTLYNMAKNFIHAWNILGDILYTI